MNGKERNVKNLTKNIIYDKETNDSITVLLRPLLGTEAEDTRTKQKILIGTKKHKLIHTYIPV